MNARRLTGFKFYIRLATSLALMTVLSAAYADPPGPPGRYQVRNLISDGFVSAENPPDAHLVNPWGIAFNPFGFVWVADNGTGFSTLYNGAGQPNSLIVAIPPKAGATSSDPTGIVFNGSTGFVVTQPQPCNPCKTGAAAFMFVTEDGVLAGWSPGVDLTHAILVKDNSGSGTVYKGLALSAGGNGQLLYATDFHNNKIDVWDSTFAPVALGPGAFVDSKLPKGFAPFGIQAINGNIYVTFAKQDAAAHDDVAGKGQGYVDVFDPNGNLIGRVASKGPLNSPWGLALAPAGFGEAANSLLVGNFGDGTINVFDIATGDFMGPLKGADNHPIILDGLWGIAFGNGFQGQPVNTLFFTAGTDGEAHGLYGRIDAVPGKMQGPGPGAGH